MPNDAPSYRKHPPKLVGGVLCLDFVNTVAWRGDPEDRGERLTRYEELLHWAAHAGILDAGAVRRLLREAARHPGAANSVVARAIELREALARLALAGQRGAAADVEVVNGMLAAAPPRAAIRARGSGYAWADGTSDDTLDAPIHPVLWSAADLLTSGRLLSVRRCGDARCGWLFLDTSPTARRRWCSMKECGNRAKVRRHYQAARKSRSGRSRSK